MDFKVNLAKTARETTSASQHPDLKVGFIKTFLHMWDGSPHLDIDRKKNIEIRAVTESTERDGEREREQEQKPFTFYVSFAAPTALSNTRKMNCYLAGRRGQEGSSVVK